MADISATFRWKVAEVLRRHKGLQNRDLRPSGRTLPPSFANVAEVSGFTDSSHNGR